MTYKKPKMKNIKQIGKALIDVFANILLWLLIWTGAVLSLINADEDLLAALLIISGIAWVSQGFLHQKRQTKQKSTRRK